jgi:methyltransferase family protein
MTKVYLPPSLLHFEPQRIVVSSWIDHLPFGYDLVSGLRPRLLVELGTHKGLSYFTFCQAIKENQIDGLCYAVDTFEGDAHTGAYDETIFQEVSEYNRRHYPGFSYITRMLFEDAARHFSDEAIDLLHIDGLHTFEAVSGDFRTWFPKVRPGGIVLFHDVQARREDFGVWKFWEDVQQEHETFTFNHGFGLGVLRKPGGNRDDDCELLDLLFRDQSSAAQEALRAFYVHASNHLEMVRKTRMLQEHKERRRGKGLLKQARGQA